MTLPSRKEIHRQLLTARQKLANVSFKHERLRNVLIAIRLSMEDRMVKGFDHDTEEYPLTVDTVHTLLFEKARLQAAICVYVRETGCVTYDGECEQPDVSAINAFVAEAFRLGGVMDDILNPEASPEVMH